MITNKKKTKKNLGPIQPTANQDQSNTARTAESDQRRGGDVLRA